MIAGSGAWLGLVASSGTVLLLWRLPLLRRVRLQDRVLPYVRDLPGLAAPGIARGDRSARSRGAAVEPSDLLRRVRGDLARRLDTALGGAESVRRRLDQLGLDSVEEFRTRQVMWAGTAVAGVLGVGLLRAAAGEPPPAALVALVAVSAAILGVVVCDQQLSRRAARTRARLLVELPPTAELLALAVAAGEGPAAALERVRRIGSGALARELSRVLAETRAGTPLTAAMERFAARCDVSAVRRFVDAFVVALERGTPLAGVLRVQAADARDAARRDLVERAARREVLMMLPVVFLVLPVSVLFALFPGFYGLTLAVA